MGNNSGSPRQGGTAESGVKNQVHDFTSLQEVQALPEELEVAHKDVKALTEELKACQLHFTQHKEQNALLIDSLYIVQEESKGLMEQLTSNQLQLKNLQEQNKLLISSLTTAQEEIRNLTDQLQASQGQDKREELLEALNHIKTLTNELQTSNNQLIYAQQREQDVNRKLRVAQSEIKNLTDQMKTMRQQTSHLEQQKKEGSQHYYVAMTQYKKASNKLYLPSNPAVLYVVNPTLQQKFEQKQREFIAKYGKDSKEASPTLLCYWNADSVNIFNVVKENFKINKLPRARHHGILFSEYPRVAHKMLICQVLPGKQNNVREGNWSVTTDLIRAKYDSECSNWENTKVQLLWNEEQVLPFYLIICR